MYTEWSILNSSSLRLSRDMASLLLLALVAVPCHGDDVCRNLCPPCVGSFCDPRNTCLSACQAIDDKITSLSTKAKDRLTTDSAAATTRINSQVTTAAASVRTHADAANTAITAAVGTARQQVQAQVVAGVDELLALRRPLPGNISKQLNSTEKCLSAPLSQVVKDAYGDANDWIAGWLSDTDSVRADLDDSIDIAVQAAQADMVRAIAAPKHAVDSMNPSANIQAAIASIQNDLNNPPVSGQDLVNRLQGYVDSGFSTLVTAETNDRIAVQSAYLGLINAYDLALAGAPQSGQLLATSLRALANDTLVTVIRTPINENVPSMALLRYKLRAESPSWPKTIGCLCQSAGIFPGAPSAFGGPENDLELITDSICAGSLFSNAFNVPLSSLHDFRSPANPQPPIDTGYDPVAARSTAGLAALAAKESTYRDWTAQKHMNDKIVLQCVEIAHNLNGTPGVNAVSTCEGFHTMANAGAHSGKLLAARAYQYGAVMSGSTLVTAAVKQQMVDNLAESLTGIYNIMMLTSSQDCNSLFNLYPADSAPVCGRIYDRSGANHIQVGSDANGLLSSDGLPVRGYAAFHVTGSGRQTVIEPPAILKDDDLFNTSPGDGYDPNHRFQGHLLGFEGIQWFSFEERGSGDDTFATLLGLTAAYDVLTKLGDTGPWRGRIVDAAERFGNYYVRNGLELRSLNGGPIWTTGAGDAINPLLHLQNLAWLRTVIYLSESYRGNSTKVLALKTQYKKLLDTIDQKNLGPATLSALAVVLDPSFRAVVKPPIRYFYQAFNSEYFVISTYLLIKYETDPNLLSYYRNIFTKVVRPIVEDSRVPWHIYAMLASITNEQQFTVSTGMSRDAAAGQAAAILRQHRTTPEPFGNPNPLSSLFSSLDEEEHYYTDFYGQANLRDPMYDALLKGQTTLVALTSRLSQLLKDSKIAVDPSLSTRDGGLYPLGPGLVPYWMSHAHALVGGEWKSDLNRSYVFGRDHTPAGGGQTVKTVRSFMQVDFLMSYWFGRYLKFLGN